MKPVLFFLVAFFPYFLLASESASTEEEAEEEERSACRDNDFIQGLLSCFTSYGTCCNRHCSDCFACCQATSECIGTCCCGIKETMTDADKLEKALCFGNLCGTNSNDKANEIAGLSALCGPYVSFFCCAPGGVLLLIGGLSGNLPVLLVGAGVTCCGVCSFCDGLGCAYCCIVGRACYKHGKERTQ